MHRLNIVGRGAIVVALGIYALVQPAAARAGTLYRDGCSHCVSGFSSCGEPADIALLCQGFGCDTGGPGCTQMGSCSGDQILISCLSDPY